MAKLRGKHYTIKTAKKQILEWMDAFCPDRAPHHLVILDDEEYKIIEKMMNEGNAI